MSQLQVTKITTVDNTTPLILATGNAGGGQIIIQSSNTDVFFNGNLRLSSFVTGDGSGLLLPSSNVANAAFNTANAAYASANNVAPQVTPAFNTANSAFNTANAAFASANNVAPQVTPSYNTANAAFNTANAAFASANNVGPQIAPTYNTANSAFATANLASNTATGAYNTANAAYNNANAAFNAANGKFSSSGGTISGAVEITADLTVHGNTRFIDQQTLSVGDPLIYLAANNYSSDVVDIGFVANYVNATSANVHTGLYRSSGTKEYYLFYGYDKEPYNNYIDPTGNNIQQAVLNSTLRTSNVILGGANTINWITAAFAKANASGANVGQTAPTGVTSGKLWWNSDLGKLFVYYTDPANTSSWIETSPSASAIEGAIITGYINPVFNTVNAAYTFANSAYASINSNWTVTNTVYGVVNAAFGKANTALQNTTGTFAGSLSLTGNLALGGISSTIYPLEIPTEQSTAIGLKIRGRPTTNDSAIRWYSNDGSTQQGYVQFGGQAEFSVLTNDHLIFKTNALTRIKVDAYGNTGFGTAAAAAPKARLHVSSNNTTLDMGLGYISQNSSFYMTNSDIAYGLIGAVAGSGDTYLQSQRTDGGAIAYNIIMQNYGGNVAIGTSSARVTLDMGSRTDGVILPAGTIAQRPTAVNGLIRKYSSAAPIEYYDSSTSSWLMMTGVATNDPLYSSTKVLIKNGSSTDYSSSARTLTATNVSAQTVGYPPIIKAGSSGTAGQAWYVNNGTNNYLNFGGTLSDFNMGQAAWTLEFWAYMPSGGSSYAHTFWCGGQSAQGEVKAASSDARFYIYSSAGQSVVANVGYLNQWFWVVFERYNNVISCWVNGANRAQGSTMPTGGTPSAAALGYPFGTEYQSHYLDEVRWTTAARYQGQLTIPIQTASWPER